MKRSASVQSEPRGECRASFVVPGAPFCKPRARSNGAQRFHSPAYLAWRERVKDEAGVVFAELADRGSPWDAHAGAFALVCRFFLDRAAGDVDNLIGGVMDALNAFAWADDRLVVDVRATKRIDKAAPRVEVELRTLSLEIDAT